MRVHRRSLGPGLRRDRAERARAIGNRSRDRDRGPSASAGLPAIRPRRTAIPRRGRVRRRRAPRRGAGVDREAASSRCPASSRRGPRASCAATASRKIVDRRGRARRVRPVGRRSATSRPRHGRFVAHPDRRTRRPETAQHPDQHAHDRGRGAGRRTGTRAPAPSCIVLDGPLQESTPRARDAVGVVKSHDVKYLRPALDRVVGDARVGRAHAGVPRRAPASASTRGTSACPARRADRGPASSAARRRARCAPTTSIALADRVTATLPPLRVGTAQGRAGAAEPVSDRRSRARAAPPPRRRGRRLPRAAPRERRRHDRPAGVDPVDPGTTRTNLRRRRESNPRTRFCRPLPEPLGYAALHQGAARVHVNAAAGRRGPPTRGKSTEICADNEP